MQREGELKREGGVVDTVGIAGRDDGGTIEGLYITGV